ncbi:MAG TPA: carbohydrate-binding family 9-like protein [Candidatus Aminicenantes bacterium]|nr:carbohydrate-binding family 9-like protein [Candidatus Aminicenantes bacterium]
MKRQLTVEPLPPDGDLASWQPVRWHPLAEAPWRDRFPYVPEVRFAIAWDPHRGIGLKWRVAEREIRAVERGFNGRVWEDSCVEFFWAPQAAGQRHYAFEFNPAGAVYGAVCPGDAPPVLLEASSLRQIGIAIPRPEEGGAWALDTLLSPVLFGEDWTQWRPRATLRANFYKCGDRHREPHYLCWNPVAWPQPSFHRPDGFGHLSL